MVNQAVQWADRQAEAAANYGPVAAGAIWSGDSLPMMPGAPKNKSFLKTHQN
jgi:hypothetical protein